MQNSNKTCTFVTAGLAALPAILEKWDSIPGSEEYNYKPFKNILITPLIDTRDYGSVNIARQLKEQGYIENVIFDSGGFQLWNKNRFKYTIDDLIEFDANFYKKEPWASIYFLPDHPMNIVQTRKNIEEHIETNFRSATKTLALLPPEIQERCCPIIHGSTIDQFEEQLDRYQQIMDLQYVGFSGRALGTESCTVSSFLILEALMKYNVKLHFLGWGSPAGVALIKDFGINSYDTASWTISAAYGRIIFPYVGEYQITPNSNAKKKAIRTQKELDEIKERFNHDCIFCKDLKLLLEDHFYRRFHNLMIYAELDEIYGTDPDPIKTLRNYNSKFIPVYDRYSRTKELPLLA